MRPQAVDRALAALAAAQHGVVSLAQLIELGLSPRAVSHRDRAGRLHRVHRGAFAVGHAALSREGRWLAAVLACGAGAALSHVSVAQALALLPGTDLITHVSVARRSPRTVGAGASVRVHRVATLRPDEIEPLGALPVTGLARTLLGVAATETPRRLARAVEAAERRGLDFAGVHALPAAQRGQPGTAALRSALVAPPDGTEDGLEERLLALVRAAGLPRPAVNVLVGPYRVDLLWEAARVVVEADSLAFHATRRAFGEDRKRDAHLQAAGFRVVRFTYADVTRDPAHVVRTLWALLRG